LTETDTRYQRISEILGDSARDDDFLIALESFIDIYKEEKVKEEHLLFPAGLFAQRKLGVLETLVKCLKENFSMSYIEIAQLLNRDERTIWSAYNDAAQKHKEKFFLKDEKHPVPANIFSDRKLGPLESLVLYLKDEAGLSIKQISELLGRKYRTIWLTYHNARKKRGENEK